MPRKDYCMERPLFVHDFVLVEKYDQSNQTLKLCQGESTLIRRSLVLIQAGPPNT